MHLRLDQLILWPKDGRYACRVLDFTKLGNRQGKGVVQVIRGTNGTGKTAIVHIIDYCLGARTSQIPQDQEFQAVDWYGLVFSSPSTRILTARRAPSTGRASSEEYYIADLPDGTPAPATLRPNASRVAFSRHLDKLVGVETDVYESSSNAEKDARPFLHDVTPFLLAPSEYLASRKPLFYTQSVPMERVKRALPITLQAATADYVRLRERERSERLKVRRLDTRVATMSGTLGQVEAAIRREFDTAMRYGLVPPTTEQPELADCLDRLDEVSRNLAGEGARGAGDRWRDVVAKRQQLDRAQRALSRERAAIRRQIGHLDQAITASREVSEGIGEAERRVRAFRWFDEHIVGEGPCPMCGSASDHALAELQDLQQMIAGLRSERVAVGLSAEEYLSARGALEAQMVELDRRVGQLEHERLSIEGDAGSLALADGGPTLADVSRFVGALEPLLGLKDHLIQLAQDRQTADVMRGEVHAMREQLASQSFEELFEGLAHDVNEYLAYHAVTMGLSHQEYPPTLALDSLSLKLGVPTGRKVANRRVDQVGSARNWMGYKVALHLALHELFDRYPDGPVPSLLVIDQPSAVDSSSDAPGIKSLSTRVFEALAHLAQLCRVQIIVLEGMAEPSYLFLDEVKIVEEWPIERRTGLVPYEWVLATEQS